MAEQHNAIFRYLQTNPYISNLIGAKELNITKVDTRIGEMIRKGYPIKKVKVHPADGMPYTRYILTDKAFKPTTV